MTLQLNQYINVKSVHFWFLLHRYNTTDGLKNVKNTTENILGMILARKHKSLQGKDRHNVSNLYHTRRFSRIYPKECSVELIITV